MSHSETKNVTGLIIAPATLIFTMGVFADVMSLRCYHIETEEEGWRKRLSDPLFTTAWLTLLVSGTYALLATIYYYVVFESDLCGLFVISGGVFMISRLLFYLHLVIRNHAEQLNSDASRLWYRVCATAVITTVFTVVYALVFWRSCHPGGPWLVFPDGIFTLYIIYLIWGNVSEIRSPRRISHDRKYVIVQHTVVFTAAVLISWMILAVGLTTVFSPLGLIGAAFNSVFLSLLFKGNEEIYEKWCCRSCHSCLWDSGNTTTSSPRAVTSGTSDKSRSSREGMIEMTAGGESKAAGNPETKEDLQYVE